MATPVDRCTQFLETIRACMALIPQGRENTVNSGPILTPDIALSLNTIDFKSFAERAERINQAAATAATFISAPGQGEDLYSSPRPIKPINKDDLTELIQLGERLQVVILRILLSQLSIR